MRLQDYDYNQNGTYFLTICSDNRRCIFSDIVGAIHESPNVKLTEYGKIVESTISQMSNKYGIIIEKYVIMPNHIHLLLSISNGQRAIHESPLQGRSVISKAVGFLKMNVSKEIHKIHPDDRVWQRSFYDHIIRNHKDFEYIYQYINENPLRWKLDELYMPY